MGNFQKTYKSANKSTNKFILSLPFLAMCLLPTVSAQADPISDALEILSKLYGVQTDMLKDTGNIADLNQKISDLSEAQLKQLQDEWAALTKSYAMGDSESDREARLWSANDWQSVLNQASGGNNDRFQQLMKSYSEKYPTLASGGGANMNMDSLVKANYRDTGKTLNAAMATSEYAYNDVNARIKKLETLLAYVDDEGKNQNEKAAMDLNSRLVAELGFTQLEILKMLSIDMQMNAMNLQEQQNLDTINKQLLKYKTD
jgi:hypothetical protein